MPRRRDYVRFRIGADELEVAFRSRSSSPAAPNDPPTRMRAEPGEDSRCWRLPAGPAHGHELAAFGRVIDAWEADARPVCRLRDQLP